MVEYQEYEITREEKPNPRKELSIIKAEIRDKLFNLRQKSASFSNRGKLDDDDRLRALKVNKQIEHWKKLKRELDVNNPQLMNKYKTGVFDTEAKRLEKLTDKSYREKLMDKYKRVYSSSSKQNRILGGSNKMRLNFLGVSR